jgi:putative ABC transport system permease protein
VVKAFPNVSVIDLTLILQTLDTVLTKIGFVVRFMAMFTVATGLFVMAGALMTGRYQRIRESVLLRTLGASRKQISRILAVEYVALGLLAASTAAVLAVLASWLLAKFLFEVKFDLDPGPLILAMLGVPALTLVLGLALNRGVTRSPPLAILRAENP